MMTQNQYEPKALHRDSLFSISSMAHTQQIQTLFNAHIHTILQNIIDFAYSAAKCYSSCHHPGARDA